MPKAVKIQESEYRYPDDLFYTCKLIAVDEIQVPYFKKDRNGVKTNEQAVFTKWEWKFEIVEGAYLGDVLRGDTRPEYTTRADNKVRQWSESLLNRELTVGEELDTDMLLGLPCIVTIRHGEPRPKSDGSNFYPCEVDEVLPKSGSLINQPPF